MSYSIHIGNATSEFSKDDGYLSARWVVEPATHPAAPTFPNDDMTGNSNSRHPSYSAWDDFCRATGLHDMFFGEENEGLMREHPGCVMLTEMHAQTITAALAAYQSEATKPPGFTDGHSPHLARILWLEFWVRWALENCETPAIQNT